MSRLRMIVLGLAGFLVAFGVGRITALISEPAPPPPARIVEQRHDRTIVERGASLDLDAVRAIVREELAQQAAPVTVVEREQPIDPDRLARAKTALGEGMADGRWTNDDRDRLRPMLARMSRTELEEILRTLFPALNTGKLRPETDGPLI
jgi:hypothetical protein